MSILSQFIRAQSTLHLIALEAEALAIIYLSLTLNAADKSAGKVDASQFVSNAVIVF